MRAAAILGLGCSSKDLRPFQTVDRVEWHIGLPSSSDPIDIILVFGGDGTIHRHLPQLARLGLPVLVVPAGSGNDFARALGIRGMRNSLAAWEQYCQDGGNIRRIDLGIISAVGIAGQAPAPQGHYFCCVAGVGIDSEVARRANTMPRWLRRNGGYVLSLAPAIFTFAPVPIKILMSSEDSPATSNWTVRSDQPTLLAAFANTSTYGGGMKIAPRAKMDDSLLDICVVGGVSPLKLFGMFPTVYSGRHLSIKEVEYFQASRVRVESEHPLEVYADGEYVCRTPVEVGIEPAALNVVVPRTRK